MYPKARLDALTDGLFGVAMTILVLDVRLPDDFHPRDHGALFRALIDLWPKFFPSSSFSEYDGFPASR